MRGTGAFAAATTALGVPVVAGLHAYLTGSAVTPRDLLLTSAAIAVTCWIAVRTTLALRTGPGPALAMGCALGLVAGHAAVALLAPSGTATHGCLPIVGRGARVGLDWLTLQPSVPCSDGTLVASTVGLAAAMSAAGAIFVTLALVTAHAAVAVAAAGAAVALTAAGTLFGLVERLVLDRLRALAAAVLRCARLLGPREVPPVARTLVPPSRVVPAAILRRGPPRTPAPHLA